MLPRNLLLSLLVCHAAVQIVQSEEAVRRKRTVLVTVEDIAAQEQHERHLQQSGSNKSRDKLTKSSGSGSSKKSGSGSKKSGSDSKKSGSGSASTKSSKSAGSSGSGDGSKSVKSKSRSGDASSSKKSGGGSGSGSGSGSKKYRSKKSKSSGSSSSKKSSKKLGMFDSLDEIILDDMSMSMPTPTPAPIPDTPAPVAPTEAPAQTPSEACNALPRDEAMLQELSSITDPSILQDSSTPQGEAFQWLLSEDTSQVNPCEYESLDQRYGLATLYYSTSRQNEWTVSTGWLSGADECTWSNVACANGMVSSLSLGKSLICDML
jgi:hypothetical protein